MRFLNTSKHPTISPLLFSSRPFPFFPSRRLTSPGCKAGRPGIAVPVKKRRTADAYNGLDFPRRRSTSAPDPRPPLSSLQSLTNALQEIRRLSPGLTQSFTRNRRVAPLKSPESLTSLTATSRISHCCIAVCNKRIIIIHY